jgi:hypothetical protein
VLAWELALLTERLRLILERFGKFWGTFSVIDLFVLNHPPIGQIARDFIARDKSAYG